MMLIKSDAGVLNYPPLVLKDAKNLGWTNGQAKSQADVVGAGKIFTQGFEASANTAPSLEDPSSIVEKARAEAAEIIAEAHAQVASIERDARHTAIEEARAELAAQEAAMIDPLREQLALSLESMENLREQIGTQSEHELVQLALEIARKVVRREVTVDRDIVLSLARVALARLHTRALSTVHLHPDDYRYVVEHRDKLGSGSTVKLLEDPSVGRGGCLIETDLGQVDARIEQQFSEIERGFLHDTDAL